MPIRMTGMASGLDTEALVSAMVSAYSLKKTKAEKNVQTLKWKKEAWSGVNKKVKTFYNNVSALRYSSAYTIKKATASDPTKATVSASSSAVNGSQKLVVSQLASSGYLTGAKLSDDTTSSSTMADLGYTGSNGKVSVSVGGKKTDIAVSSDMKISDFVSKLKDAGVNASFDEGNKRIFVSSKTSGKDNDFTLDGANSDGISALSKLGLNASSSASNELYAKYAAYKDLSKDDIANILQNISDNNDLITEKKSDIATLNDKKSYAENYKNAYDVITQLSVSDDEKSELESHLSQAKLTDYVGAKDAEGKYIYYDKVEEGKDDEGNTTYTYSRTVTDDEGNKTTETYVSSDKLQTISERVNEIAESDSSNLLTKKVEQVKKDDEGNPVLDGDGKEVKEEVDKADSTAINTLYNQLRQVKHYQDFAAEGDTTVTDVRDAYIGGTVDTLTAGYDSEVSALNAEVKTATDYNKQYELLDTGSYTADDAQALYDKIQTYAGIIDGTVSADISAGAVRVNGQDSKITLNGAEYTSNTNSFTINGLNINVTGVTDSEGITVTTETDSQAVYDKVKDFLKQYNELMTEMNKLYNAESAKGYEPLTDEEKEAMTDDQIEKWEKKIQDASLRNDQTLRNILYGMSGAMAKTYTINGKSYSLSTLGIKTKSYFESSDNDNYEYHIDGDADDSYSSGNQDKLMDAINNDSEGALEFLKKLSEGLYKNLDAKMKSNSMSSSLTVYNDKKIDSDLKTAEKLVSSWEDKITEYEDTWYSKFATMESTLSKLQSQQSQLGSYIS